MDFENRKNMLIPREVLAAKAWRMYCKKANIWHIMGEQTTCKPAAQPILPVRIHPWTAKKQEMLRAQSGHEHQNSIEFV